MWIDLQVLFNIAVTEIKQDDLHAGEDTLHQAIYNTELGQRGLIQEALNNLQVMDNFHVLARPFFRLNCQKVLYIIYSHVKPANHGENFLVRHTIRFIVTLISVT